MHEHGLADRIFELLLEQMQQRSASRIVGATLHVGEFSGLTEDALCHGLEHCAEHHGMAPFPVTVVTEGPLIRCADCRAESPLGDAALCSACGSESVEILPATGITIRHVELQ